MPTTPKPRTRFVDLYRARGYTQETLAAATGVSQSAVSRYGSGRTILAEHVAALAIALDTSPAYLDGATDDPAPAPATDAAEHTLESAILRALDKARHTLADARAVEDVLRGTIGLVKAAHLDAAAREWLDAAAALRRLQQPVTVATLLVEVTAELNAAGDRELARLGAIAPKAPTKLPL